MNDVEKFTKLLKNAGYAVFFGGAGVSTESGVPDFRSKSGIYEKVIGAESILTPGFLENRPEDFYKFYRKYFILDGVQPNACHRALAQLEKEGVIKAVITQNVDNLHQTAGSKNVFELHGTGEHFTCTRCGKKYPLSEVRKGSGAAYCSCGGVLHPDIVLYEEALPEDCVMGAISELRKSDFLIIGGTSLTVYPAASFVRYQYAHGKKVLIDLKAEPNLDVEMIIRQPIAEFFAEVMRKW